MTSARARGDPTHGLGREFEGEGPLLGPDRGRARRSATFLRLSARCVFDENGDIRGASGSGDRPTGEITRVGRYDDRGVGSRRREPEIRAVKGLGGAIPTSPLTLSFPLSLVEGGRGCGAFGQVWPPSRGEPWRASPLQPVGDRPATPTPPPLSTEGTSRCYTSVRFRLTVCTSERWRSPSCRGRRLGEARGRLGRRSEATRSSKRKRAGRSLSGALPRPPPLPASPEHCSSGVAHPVSALRAPIHSSPRGNGDWWLARRPGVLTD